MSACVHQRVSPSCEELPSQLGKLRPRMKEIATLVYREGGATALQVRKAMPDPPSIYAVRTMLNRLSRKDVLRRRASGRHSSILYLPAIVTDEVREAALRRFLRRSFNDSAPTALEVVLQLL